VIKSFISTDATVVVGTVIDPSMTDNLRVTVVVTGLGGTGDNNATAASQSASIVEVVVPVSVSETAPIVAAEPPKDTVVKVNVGDGV